MIKKLLIKKYYKEKLSFSKIAILLGITPQAIYYWFKKYNLKPRNNSESKKGKSVHHIDYNKQNCKENNLITLCLQCNNRVNSNRNYWKEYFQNKSKETI